MNRSSTNTQKFNYAQAAAQPKSNQHQTHHQNQQQQQQQQKIQQATGPSPSNNSTSSVNGKSSQKPQPLTNSTLSNGNVGRSSTENKVTQQKNPVTLPAKGRQWETNTSIQFGSINQPSVNPPLSSSPVQPSLVSGGSLPPPLPKSGPTFGTVTARGSSEELVQPTPTQPAVAPTGPGSITGVAVAKPLATRIQNEIPRTQSAPPLLNLQDSTNAKNVGQPPGHQMNSVTPHTQQQLSTATPLQSISTSNPPPHNRKDSVSSTVSSNDGQQPPPFHPHQPQPHHNNYNQQHAHPQYHSRHIHQHHKGPPQVPSHFQQKNRDRSVPGTIPPSSHSNPQTVPNQAQTPIPLTGPQAAIPVPMWQQYGHGHGRSYESYYPSYYAPTVYMPVLQRPPMQVTHHMQPTVSSYTPPGPKNHAVKIINPADRSVVVPSIQHNPHVIQAAKKEEAPTPIVFDAKRIDDSTTKEKEQASDNEKKESKAVRIVDPIERDKIEREKREKEREENERKELEEKERLEKEKKEREEKERLEREEKERKEREEKERKEREEKERKEREEKEREERERKEREERERREREERERKEREEKERKEREEKERKEREEKERKEREEQERKEREEREEKERKEREEKERKEREEKERKEREEKERKEREEKERMERERLEREEKERREREEAEQREKEQLERNAQEERERIEKEEMERQISEKKKKEAEEEEKKMEMELSDKKDNKKEEKKYGKGHKPEALDLSRTISAPTLPGPLSSARIIDDLSSVQYPAHIKSPNPELNTNSEPGKFKYDRKFLMQFMDVCKERPDNLPVLDAVGMEEPKDDKRGGAKNSRPGSQRASQNTKSSPGQMQYSQMGEFRHAKNSDERFMPSSSNYGSRTGFKSTLGPRTGSGSTILQPPINVTNPPSPGRTQSNPRRNDKHKKNGYQTQHGQNMGHDPVQPLEFTENRWVPHNKALEDRMHMETVQRKVKALLNKLTLEKFDSISDQIIEFANKSKDQRDGSILKEVISLTFDKSCDEPNFSQMYAQLCRKMMERIDPEIVDENMKNQDKYVQGGALFRKYLLNRCQENFEKGWKVNIPVPANEKGEPDLMSDEYYTAAKAKRHGLGLIRFIGELFKLNMLTERIMHECIKKLLSNGNPEEEEMESLCKLLTTVGRQLDHLKAKSHMDQYFNRMKDMSGNDALNSRIRFMLMDVIELRNNEWVPRRDNNAPKTIAEIHEDAAKQKEEAEYMRRTTSSGGRGLPKMADQMSRTGSGRRDKGSGPHGSGGQQTDGWSTVSSSASRKTGDLSKFGSVRNKVSGNVNLTPGGGAFSKWKTENKDRDDKTSGMARANSTSNTYSVLTHTDTETRKPSEGPFESQKSSSMERKKLQLMPPSKTISDENNAPKSIMTKSSSASSMSEETARKKIDNMIEEYFNVLDIGEVIYCINDLPKEYHSMAITEIANKVLEKKQEDVYKVTELFKTFVTKSVITKPIFMKGFSSTVEFLVDIGADAPKSYAFTGQLFYDSSIELKEVAELLKPLLEVDDDKGIEKVVSGYLDAWKKVSDEQAIMQKVKETGFDFKSIFSKKSISDINKFFDDHGLGSLKK